MEPKPPDDSGSGTTIEGQIGPNRIQNVPPGIDSRAENTASARCPSQSGQKHSK
jgi:hypothetical protein